MKRPARAAHRRAAALAGGIMVLALAGCAWSNDETVLQAYDPSDGVGAELRDAGLLLRNVLVVGTEAGEPGEVVAVVVNVGTRPATVELTADVTQGGEVAAIPPTRVQVPAGQSVQVGPGQRVRMSLPELGVAAGQVLQMTAATPEGGTVSFAVPVLRPEGPYASLTPAPTTPGAAPEVTTTGEPSATPSESATQEAGSGEEPTEEASPEPTATT